jgi:uncharacterized repeat protein (TIGR03803 family)
VNGNLKVWVIVVICAGAASVSPAQTFTTLVNFEGTNGCYPFSGPLVQATNGKIYGTAEICGANNYGTVFEVTPTGTLTTLHDFGSSDGIRPYAGLVQDTNGYLYGATAFRGAYGYGTFFK